MSGAGAVCVDRLRWREGAAEAGERVVPAETAVALTYDASTYAVMMATPLDLEDFALGFSLSEGVIAEAAQVRGIDIVDSAQGIEARIWLDRTPGEALAGRRRRMAGPTGCGLCGVDSLAEAARPAPPVEAELTLSPDQALAAIASLASAQALNGLTRAVHAAGFWTPEGGLVLAREDVGRHNALDKLAGGLARGGVSGRDGVVLLTSRVSVEMVQKSAVIGAGVLIAVSAPTALAVQTAQAAGITLIAVARADGFEVFSHPGRVTA